MKTSTPLRRRLKKPTSEGASSVAIVLGIILAFAASGASAPSLKAQELGKVCGDPASACSTSFQFKKNDLPFIIKGTVEFKEYKSEFFYAVVLKSVRATNDNGGDCAYVSEQERVEAQRLLPGNKAFTSRFGCAEAQILYDDVNRDYNFLAVFGGATKAAAEKILQRVKSRYPGANVRRMQVIRAID